MSVKDRARSLPHYTCLPVALSLAQRNHTMGAVLPITALLSGPCTLAYVNSTKVWSQQVEIP